ncbi:MAG TPA: hypothetical protein VIF57_24360 [Polyangia bacterium]|jgi:hypothetical protein
MVTCRALLGLLAFAIAARARPASAQSVPAAPPPAPSPPMAPVPTPPLVPAPSTQTGATQTPPAAPPPSDYRPHIVIELDFGYETGGDDLGRPANYGATGLKAGSGGLVNAVGSFTPLWFRDRLGLGVGFSFGYKYDSTAASGLFMPGASFSRYPVSAFAQTTLRLHGRWFTFLRGGPGKVVSTDLTGAGETVSSKWGAVVEWGACRWFKHQFGLALLLRYTHLDVAYQGETSAADSLGAALAVSFGD